MPKTLSLLAVLKKVDAKGLKSLSNAQWDTFLASDTEPNEIQEKIAKLEGYEEKGATYDATGELIVEDNQAMIDRFKERTGRGAGRESLKVKKSKIDVKSFKENFLDRDEEPVEPDITGASDLATIDKPSVLSKPDPVEEEETEGLKGIRDVLDDILGVLRLDFKGDRKEARDRQKEVKQQKRTKKENKLEGGVKKSASLVGKAVGEMLKPFQGIWDAIINFLKFTLIGTLFTKTMKWFGDPKNQKKAERIGKFFKDWWPALSAAALLFLTPLGALIKGMVGLLTAIIPKIVMAIAANPWSALALVGTGLAVWGISKLATGGEKKQKSVDNEGDGTTTERTSQSFTTRGGPQAEQLKNQMAESRGEETQGFNQGGLVNVVDAQTSAQNFIHKFNGGGVVEHFNEGGMVGKELVYSIRKFTTEKVVKGDEIERTKTRERTTGAIQLEDLYENQDQILSQLPEGTTIESIVNGTSGIDPQVLYPILQSSDAQMASTAKERAIDMQMMQDNNLINSDNTVKGFSSYDQNFKGGGSVKGFNKGGEVPGSGNNDTVPAMLTPGEFVMSKGAVHKYGVDTLENMNAAAGSSKKSKDTVPSMLTPGEFVVSAPAVQKYGVDTLESMNLKGGGNNKPEIKVGANKGGLINNYNNTLMKYQGGGEVKSVGESDSRVIIEIIEKVTNKNMDPVNVPVPPAKNTTITLPTIPKAKDEPQTITSKNDLPDFRISMVSPQRKQVISTLGIQDLVRG